MNGSRELLESLVGQSRLNSAVDSLISSHSHSCPKGRPLLCAFLFASLLNLKHINMYLAPSFFVFLLRSYIIPPGTTLDTLPASFERLATLGTVTLLPFGLSLGPLLVDGMRHEQGPLGVVAQMVSRLFPFSRGLNHAYWAPNAWALWTAADRVLLKGERSRLCWYPQASVPLTNSIDVSLNSLPAETRGGAETSKRAEL